MSELVFPIVWPRDAGIEHFGLEMWIQREMSFAESAPKTTEVIVNKADMHRIIFFIFSSNSDSSARLLLRLIPEGN